MVFEALAEPHVLETNLTESNPDVIYNLEGLDPNTFVVGSAQGIIELYIISQYFFLLVELDIYSSDRTIFLHTCDYIANNTMPSMPKVYVSNDSIPIYAARKTDAVRGFAYFRKPECKFVH